MPAVRLFGGPHHGKVVAVGPYEKKVEIPVPGEQVISLINEPDTPYEYWAADDPPMNTTAKYYRYVVVAPGGGIRTVMPIYVWDGISRGDIDILCWRLWDAFSSLSMMLTGRVHEWPMGVEELQN